MTIDIHPLTPERWSDLETLFGPRGAVGGCWCMWNRLTGREFEAGQGERNRAALRRIVDRGGEHGLLAYRDGEPVGWVSMAPRFEFGRINRSPVTKPVDDVPVWSIVCFFIPARHRRQGVAGALLAAAVEHAAGLGALAVEAYPVEPRTGEMPDIFAWRGLPSMFVGAGFREVARRSPTRPIMRKVVTADD